jgi:bla regulator protein BlaR1
MSDLANHLWQSTWFAVAAWALARVASRDSAQVRYWIWFAASLKFLVPFAMLSWIGHRFVVETDQPILLPIVQYATAPIQSHAVISHELRDPLQSLLFAIWILGAAMLAVRWLRQWSASQDLLRSSAVCELDAPVAVRTSTDITEPMVCGVLQPTLVIPSHLLGTLSTSQIDAILAHELWHVRRRDNLASLLHTCVEVLFWFHPFVWGIGRKLIEEREHACDEGVVADGHDAKSYAETLVLVCRHAVVRRDLLAASAAGGDLVARIRTILSAHSPSRFVAARRAVLLGTLLACTTLPVVAGMRVIATSAIAVMPGALSLQVSGSAEASFIVLRDDYLYARNVSMRELISDVYAVSSREVTSDGTWLDQPRYDVELRSPVGHEVDQRQLVADLLDRQFNIELRVNPSVDTQSLR